MLEQVAAPLLHSFPRAAIVMLGGVLLARLLGPRTIARHAILLSVLGVQVVMVLHAVFAPGLTWDVLPGPLSPIAASPPAAVLTSPAPLPSAPPVPGPLPAPDHLSLAVVLGAAWLLGTAAMLLRLAMGFTTLRTPASLDAPSDRCRAALRQARASLRLRRPIEMRVDPEANQPYAFGWWRPVIALPAASRDWTAAEARAVIAHEAAHIARGDQIAHLIGHLACAIMWPNPLVHLARREAERLREQLADARAVATGIAPVDYVTAVVNTVGRVLPSTHQLATALAMPRSDLHQRMMKLLAPGQRRTGPDGANVVIAFGVAPLVGLATAALNVAVPALPMEFCAARNGSLLDVSRPLPDGRVQWLVQWGNDTCRIDWRATGTAAVHFPAATLALPANGDSVHIAIRQDGTRRALVASRDADGTIVYRLGDSNEASHTAPPWLADFLLVLERHTARSRAARIPGLLAAGGAPAVLDEAREMSGGHAASLYLTDLVRSTSLTEAQHAEALDLVTGAAASNDAALEQLLLAVATHAPLDRPGLRQRFLAATDRLRASAARESVLAALEAHTP